MRNVLITGATGAIGKATVFELMRHPDLNLILVGRDPESLTKLKSDLVVLNPQNSVDIVIAELSEIRAAKSVCEYVTGTYSNLFAFINLAAVIKRQRTLTSENVETMFSTNYCCPFYLATRLSKVYAGSLKIVFVTSSSTSKVDFDNLQGEITFSSIPNFSQSKTCNVLFIKKISREFSSIKSRAIGFDPGIVRSHSMKELPKILQVISFLIGRSPEKAAKALAKIVTEDRFENGLFYNKYLQVVHTSPYSEDISLQDRLFHVTNDLLKDKDLG